MSKMSVLLVLLLGLTLCGVLLRMALRTLCLAVLEAGSGRRAPDAATEAKLAELAARLKRLEERMHDVEECASRVPHATVAPSGFNIMKRARVIRMSRRGDQPHQIAAALGVPEREVELLLKVHRIVLKTGAVAGPAEAAPRANTASGPAS